jgi:hypothetical protein
MRWLRMAFGLAFLMGLIALPSVMSMQVRHMGMTSEAGAFLNNKASGGHTAPTPCCNDTIGALSMTCGALIPHSTCATHFVGTQRVAFFTYSVQITYHDISTPPPKI